MIDIMLDLETWGTTPGSDLRSIGACVFNPTTGFVHDGTPGTIAPFYIATDNPKGFWAGGNKWVNRDGPFNGRHYKLERDLRTVQWWSEQSEQAQAAFADPVDLHQALVKFSAWLDGICGPGARPQDGWEIRLWSHGAAFDPPILAAAYAACNLPVPWLYCAPRDTRTLFDAAGIMDHSTLLAQHPGPMGVSHHALDDAICQARAVCSTWCILPGRASPMRRDYLDSMGDMEGRN